MGNQQPKFSQKLSNKYDFIQYQKDATLGPIKIYRKRQPFYNYLMVVDRWVNESDIPKHSQQLSSIDERQKGQAESMLLKIFGKQVVQDSFNNNCGRKLQYRLYVEYLNYTLKNLVDYRNHQRAKFTLNELMYVLNSVLQIYHFFSSIDATEFSFHSQEIFVNPDGQIKFNPLQIFPKLQTHETDCVETNCMPVRFKKTFRIQDKLILYEIKKIVTEMTELCDSRTVEDRKVFALKKIIKNCNNVEQIEELMWRSPVQRLEFNPKKPMMSEKDTTKGLSVSNSSKISVKYAKR